MATFQKEGRSGFGLAFRAAAGGALTLLALGLAPVGADELQDSSLREIASRLHVQDSAVVKEAREAIRALTGWKQRATDLGASEHPADRALGISLISVAPRDSSFTSTLGARLADPDAKNRARAASLLGAWKPGEDLPKALKTAIRERLKKEDVFEIRYLLVESLSASATAEDQVVLSGLAKDPVPEIRITAIHGLGNIALGPEGGSRAAKESVATLDRLSTSAEARDRRLAKFYLEEIKGRGGSP